MLQIVLALIAVVTLGILIELGRSLKFQDDLREKVLFLLSILDDVIAEDR